LKLWNSGTLEPLELWNLETQYFEPNKLVHAGMAGTIATDKP